jgi:hypothetical protein
MIKKYTAYVSNEPLSNKKFETYADADKYIKKMVDIYGPFRVYYIIEID